MNQGLIDGLFNSSQSDTPESNDYRKGKILGAMIILVLLLTMPLVAGYLGGASFSIPFGLFSLCLAVDYILSILRTAKELKR